MKTRLALLCAVAATALVSAGVASAAGHSTLGTPGTPNCHGQTIAFLNEFSKAFDVHGIGNLADAFPGLTVKEIQAEIKADCA